MGPQEPDVTKTQTFCDDSVPACPLTARVALSVVVSSTGKKRPGGLQAKLTPE